MQACSFVAIVLPLVGSGLSLYGGFTTDWYEIEPNNTTTIKVGLLQSCVQDECKTNDFKDQAGCDRSGSGMTTRINAILGLLISAAIVAVIAIVLIAVSFAKPTTPAKPLAVFGCVLATAAVASSLALFVYTVENWYFCDKSYCAYNNTPGCKNGFAMSFYIACGGGLALLIAFICQLVAMLTGAPPSEPEAQQPSPANRGGQQASSANEPHAAYAADDNGVPPPPDGDWTYDAGSGLYWSEREYLYVDTVTNQYYDPKSGQWYDPQSQTWYFRD